MAIRQAIVQLKAEHPPFRPNELATICQVRFERRPSRAITQKILSTEPGPETVQRRFLRYAEMADPLDRRGAIVPLHAQGWNLASIAGYLETSRPTVYATLKRWIEEGVHGLADRPPLPQQPATKTTLWAMNEVRKLQQSPLRHAATVGDENGRARRYARGGGARQGRGSSGVANPCSSLTGASRGTVVCGNPSGGTT